ncbi:MAG: 3-hydroxyacyl-CoA dehydrogenase family protein, partial [Novosphingobium sp.]|nr:3-hydroxyacyl-CoA dehydrogenase family protein [Novosphingobium sp.]
MCIRDRLEIKQRFFADIEAIVRADCVLASNTSSLSIAAIASGCTHKQRVCGLHFFNPVPLMKLVEVVCAPATSSAVIETAIAFSHQIGKVPVKVKDAPGFMVNLQGRAYTLEGLALLHEQVADPATIDRIMRDGAGFRMGPFELLDLTGIDVNYPASIQIYEGYHHDPRLKTWPQHALMVHAGLLGRKTGQGFFSYANGAAFAPSPPAPEVPVRLRVSIADPGPQWDAVLAATGRSEGDDAVLVAPLGEDCASACHRLGLDPARTVAVDLTAVDRRHLTVMNAPGGGDVARRVADWLRGAGFLVEVIADSPGFVLQRMLGMIANLGCELAQIGIGSPEDIDTAMKLAQNYPKGPLEWADWMGTARTYEIMRQIHAITGSDRYRPSLWLRRRALLGLSAHTPN